MFRAIGIGYSRSLPSAAALNWVLKDGLGRLSRCIYTASLASAFDTNLKVLAQIYISLVGIVTPKFFLLIYVLSSLFAVLAVTSTVFWCLNKNIMSQNTVMWRCCYW